MSILSNIGYKLNRKMEEENRMFADITAKKRNEAESTIKLMLNSVKHKIEEEEAKRGIVIRKAIYGNLQAYDDDISASRPTSGAEKPYFDVTIPVQYQVQKSRIHLEPHSKAGLLGFYDPCPGYQQKKLLVKYRFKGKMHQVIVGDTEKLEMPLASHALRKRKNVKEGKQKAAAADVPSESS